jgi:hypothetical protein
MTFPTALRVLRLAAALLLVGAAAAPARAQEADAVQVLLRRLERIVQTSDAPAFLAIVGSSAEQGRMQDFAALELTPGVTRAVIQERDREALRGALPGEGFRLIVDVFAEFGNRARAATWRLDVRQAAGHDGAAAWLVVDAERLSAVESLYRLTLNTTRQFNARDLRIGAEDLDLTLAEGSVFVCSVDQGVTALVLLGRGTMNFHPSPATEKGQVRIFAGADSLESAFDSAFIRINPGDFDQLIAASQLEARPAGSVDPRDLKRAAEVFREESPKSFLIDLGDLSRDAWSLLPGPTDFLAEVHTRRFETLTYAKSGAEAEDITLFDRRKHRNISIYPSKQKLATRGRFYDEDDLVDYDVIDYDIDVASTPDRQWIEGKTRIFLKTRAYVLNTITLKLADSLNVQSIVSNELGRLFGIRVKNQNTVVVNLPSAVLKDTTLTLTVIYSGRLEPQTPEREAIAVGPGDQRASSQETDAPVMTAEPSFLYSSRTFWYPQAVVSDYATARIRLSVPAALEAVASGELEPGFPTLVPARDPAQARKLYAFVASQPLRYLAFIVSRFMRAETVTIGFPEPAAAMTDGIPMTGLSYRSLNLSVEANPRQTSRGHDLAGRTADIAAFYQSIIGDSPYSSFTVALIESDLPGGHSPAYFAALNQPLPTSQLVWRNDPAAFSNFPEFFIAHEVAHQWWGQAVGWQNYHEQWISEGFAQYFAAMYAQHQRGDDAFAGVMKQLRRWGVAQSDQGPVYLGYRLGHIRGESRVFRALVYNKSAAVLHMLRRLVGDDVFFDGVRRFYRTMRFKKAGTEDFREAMEAASGRPLERFFERWIYGATLPRLTYSHRVEGSELVVHVEQLGEIFDVPFTLALNYGDRKTNVVVRVTDRVVETRIPLDGTLRGVDVNKDDPTLAEITKTS